MRALLPTTLLLAACGGGPESKDDTAVETDAGTDASVLTLRGPAGGELTDVRIGVGWGSQTILEQLGSYRFDDVQSDVVFADRFVESTSGDAFEAYVGDQLLARLRIGHDRSGVVALQLEGMPSDSGDTPRLVLQAACDDDEVFLGAGSHALDVEHTGEAFALWVSEPGLDKVDSEIPTGNWFQTGTRHASSYPVPFLLRAAQPSGLLVDTSARVEVDLCKTDPERFSVTVWDHTPTFHLVDGETPLEVVERLTDITGRPRPLPDWALMPWIDTFGDVDTLEATVAAVRDAGAPGSVVWTEDWKGASANATGYRLSESWSVDTTAYPDTAAIASSLADNGWAWVGYFAPFVGLDHPVGDEARAEDALIMDAEGEVVTFSGANFKPTSLVDLTRDSGRAFATSRMQAAVDLGFRGWMTDFAEWLPMETVLDDGRTGLEAHNDYPLLWQTTVESVLEPIDGVHFCRSGWVGTAATCPIVWLGDQSTDFEPEDGLPTIVPLALGLSASGIPVTTHDVAGYQSFGTTPRDRELWFRWTSLGAFSPILRTHHGSSAFDNVQLDEGGDTLAHWAWAATEHARLWPYRAGLATLAATRGTPMLLPTSFVVPGEPWDRIDAWMLGSALLVAPVLERGATARDVALPAGGWIDYWSRAAATGGSVPSKVDEIPVFVREGTIVPLFEVVPDTLLSESIDTDLVTMGTADRSRRLLVVGTGGRFTERDGTTYTVTGTPTMSAEVSDRVLSGTIEVGGVAVEVSGAPFARDYIVELVQLP